MSKLIRGLKFTIKGGKGSGHHGHSGGVGGSGNPGGSLPFGMVGNLDKGQLIDWELSITSEAGQLAYDLTHKTRFLKGAKGVYDKDGKLQASFTLVGAVRKGILKPFPPFSSSVERRFKTSGSLLELTQVSTAPWNLVKGGSRGYGTVAALEAIRMARKIGADYLGGARKVA